MKFFQMITMLLCLSSTILSGQQIAEIDREGITSLTRKSNDTTYVINFWATWCSPCVKEIGYFEELHRKKVSQHPCCL